MKRNNPSYAVQPLEGRTLLSVQLVADVNTDTFPSNPIGFATLGDRGLFFAQQPDGKEALWRTDGTAAGTAQVLGGFAMSKFTVLDQACRPVVAGGKAYFGFGLSSGGYQLWVTDGTSAGTRFLANVRPGFATSGEDLPVFVALGDRVFFNATDAASGTELWSTDGTPGGTARFLDVVPGTVSGDVCRLTAAGPYVFFEAIENNLRSLWRTDGTPQGTLRLAQFSRSGNSGYVAANGKVYFAAAPAGEVADQIWESDGTPEGTRRVLDLSAMVDAFPREFTLVNGTLYFTARTDASTDVTLWRSDFTPAGTMPVPVNPPAGFNPGLLRASPSSGQLFFYASDPVAGRELWRSDGTAGGTYRLADVRPGTASSIPPFGFRPVVTAAGAYFMADDGTTGAELYYTNGGAAAGDTYRVKDIYPGSQPAYYTTQGAALPDGRLLFSVNDPAVGYEPDVSDGTAAGTHPILDINTISADSTPIELIDAGGVPLVAAGSLPTALRRQGSTGPGLLRVGPSGGAATFLSYAIPSSTEVNTTITGRGTYEYATFGGHTYYYIGYGGTGGDLYRTDGTTAGTGRFFDFVTAWPSDNFGRYRHLAILGDRLYFAGPDNQAGSGVALYRTDGTAAGTEVVAHAPRRIANLAVAGDALYFAIDATVKRIRNAEPSPVSLGGAAQPITDLKVAGGKVLFTASPTGVSDTLYAIDAATGGSATALGPAYGDLVVFKDKVYYPGAGYGLTASDGTPQGTRGFTPPAGGNLNGVKVLRVVGDYLYFVPDEFKHGSEWWRTDGTDAGTALVADIVPGKAGSSPTVPFNQEPAARSIALWRGSIYFTAQTPAAGAELWRMDASAAGTPVLVADLFPGAASSDPTTLTVIGDELYFIATRPDVGREIFRVVDDLPPMVADAAFDPAGAGRVRVPLNEAVTVQAGAAAPTLTNRATGQPVPADHFAVSYDAATRTLRVIPTAPLADGDYRLTVPAGYLADAAGNPLAADFTFDFFVLAGDVDRDGAVGFADLVAVAQNYDGVGKTYAQGDVNGDGKVDFADLVVIAQKYDATLPPLAAANPPAPARALATPITTTARGDRTNPKAIFSVTPVARPLAAKPKPTARQPRR